MPEVVLAEADAVMAVVKAEHEAFWMQDYAVHARCHLHGPDTWFWSYWRHGGLAIRHGWDEIRERTGHAMAAFIAPSPSYAFEVSWEEIVVRIGGDTAWVTYKQRYPSTGGPIKGLQRTTSLSHQLRILEKHQGEWKIVLVSVLIPGLDQFDGAMLRLEPTGTIIWKSESAGKLLDEDDHLVVRNGRLRVRDRAADQKLQSAIRWASELDGFLMARRGAVPIVVDAGEGLPPKLWWLIGDSGMILFSFGHHRLTEDRLAMSAMVFGLSPGQIQVAARIVEGLSLVDIARCDGVSVNTVRTQLRRIFEKVGVHNQPALVRVLLSVAPPR